MSQSLYHMISNEGMGARLALQNCSIGCRIAMKRRRLCFVQASVFFTRMRYPHRGERGAGFIEAVCHPILGGILGGCWILAALTRFHIRYGPLALSLLIDCSPMTSQFEMISGSSQAPDLFNSRNARHRALVSKADGELVRLFAIPATTHCVPCSQVQDDSRLVTGRLRNAPVSGV